MKPIRPTEFRALLACLSAAGVEFIIVGGVAGFAHGSARITLDLDVVYRRTADNLDRLVAAIKPLNPYPRGAPPGLPFVWDRRSVEFGLNFTLVTSLGLIDLLGEITGGGAYDDLLPHTVRLNVFGITCSCVDLKTLIRVKRAAGRPRDFEAIAELETVRDENRQPDE